MTGAHLCHIFASTMLLAAAGCSSHSAQTSQPARTPQSAATQQASSDVEYRNQQYDFCFLLPASWKGYSIVADQWEGFNQNGPQGYQVVEHGPLISIRHPLWTKENPRQDIPIMVFTRQQWDSLQKDEFHIGAAPIGPSQLGENEKYVFALPARYNFGELTGTEDVGQIIQGKPLHGSCKSH